MFFNNKFYFFRFFSIIAFVLSANFNLLAMQADSLFTKTPEEVMGLVTPETFYEQNSLLEAFPAKIDTPIAGFQCASKKIISSDSSLVIDEIKYNGVDKTTNDYILFGIKTHYDIKSSSMMRWFWIEVYSNGEIKPGFENKIVLEKDDIDSNYSYVLNSDEVSIFIQKFFNEVFIARVGDCARFN